MNTKQHFIFDPGGDRTPLGLLIMEGTWSELCLRMITLITEWKMDWSRERLVIGRTTTRLL